MKITALVPVIHKLSALLSRKHKAYLIVLSLLTIGLSLIETIGISVIMPFISVASNPGLLDSGWYKTAFDFFKFAEKNDFIIALGVGIIIFYGFRAVYSISHTYLIHRFSQALGKYFSHRLFKTFLSMPFRIYAQKNSAVLMQAITSEAGNISNVALNVLQLSSELFTILLVYALMVIVN